MVIQIDKRAAIKGTQCYHIATTEFWISPAATSCRCHPELVLRPRLHALCHCPTFLLCSSPRSLHVKWMNCKLVLPSTETSSMQISPAMITVDQWSNWKFGISKLNKFIWQLLPLSVHVTFPEYNLKDDNFSTLFFLHLKFVCYFTGRERNGTRPTGNGHLNGLWFFLRFNNGISTSSSSWSMMRNERRAWIFLWFQKSYLLGVIQLFLINILIKSRHVSGTLVRS